MTASENAKFEELLKSARKLGLSRIKVGAVEVEFFPGAPAKAAPQKPGIEAPRAPTTEELLFMSVGGPMPGDPEDEDGEAKPVK